MYKICSIEVEENNKMTLHDCNGNEIKSTNVMNRRYRKSRRLRSTEEDNPVVWVLIGKDIIPQEKYLQVGQSKNLTRMLSGDIRPDVNEILSKNGRCNGSKYSKLASKYSKLTFYEIDFEDYDLAEVDFVGNMPQDEDLKKAYLSMKASFIEGKIAAEKCCGAKENGGGIWNASPSGLDGYFYSYFKNKSKMG